MKKIISLELKNDNTKIENYYCMFHMSDMDGWVSASILDAKFHFKEIFPYTYHMDLPKIETDKEKSVLYILDVFPGVEKLYELSKHFHKIILIDHHITTQTEILENLDITKLKSGFEYLYDTLPTTWMVYKYLTEHFFWTPNDLMIDMAINISLFDIHISDEDLLRMKISNRDKINWEWVETIEYFARYCTEYSSIKKLSNYFEWSNFMIPKENEISEIAKTYKSAYETISHQIIDKYLIKPDKYRFTGIFDIFNLYDVALINTSNFNNASLFDSLDKCEYVICCVFSLNKNMKWGFNFFSKDIDLLDINIGLKGHPQEAGILIDNLTDILIINK